MKITSAEFATAGVQMDQYPKGSKPEIVFIGRSNVGKSSLINALLRRKALAKTSGQPGKTRTINFFAINDRFYVVDVPGYGYAKASKSESANWSTMISEYLIQRPQLRVVVMLVDVRHSPSKDDVEMYEWLAGYDRDIIVVATKADKISRQAKEKNLAVIKKDLKLRDRDTLIGVSSEKKDGIGLVWDAINDYL